MPKNHLGQCFGVKLYVHVHVSAVKHMFIEVTRRGIVGRRNSRILVSVDESGCQFSGQDWNNALVGIHLLSSHPFGRQYAIRR
jgi:hypothetical protein